MGPMSKHQFQCPMTKLGPMGGHWSVDSLLHTSWYPGYH